jgi:hypothetical protein
MAEGRAGVNDFLCAQLLHFLSNLDQTFREYLSSNALAYINDGFLFKYFGRNMVPCLK